MSIEYTGYNFILQGNALDRIQQLPGESVDCIVTSPPYFGLRDYGVSGQIGLEESPEQYIEKLVTLFRECRRVLKDTGTFWLNLGDSYAGSNKGVMADGTITGGALQQSNRGTMAGAIPKTPKIEGLKPKDLMMIPARVALALQADGWFLRSQIIWHKPNAMPESVTDRPTNDYEMVYLLSKSPKYFYDLDAIREPVAESTVGRGAVDFGGKKGRDYTPDKNDPNYRGGSEQWGRTYDYRISSEKGRNKRAVWAIATKPYSEAHFATMPQELADNCIKAGCPKGGVVLDPFGGAGTTAVSAIANKRHYILFELNPAYISLAQKRIRLSRIEASQLDMFAELSA